MNNGSTNTQKILSPAYAVIPKPKAALRRIGVAGILTRNAAGGAL